MRLLLDAHISAQRVAMPLRDRGHDVRAADEERKLDGSADEELLALAAEEERVLVTCDVKDFPAIVRRWAEAGHTHAGCAIIVKIDHGEFGAILDVITRAIAVYPVQADWTDLTLFLARTQVRPDIPVLLGFGALGSAQVRSNCYQTCYQARAVRGAGEDCPHASCSS